MEKRNFVTNVRTSGVSGIGDELVDAAVNTFGEKQEKTASDMAKKASAEDEKTDSLEKTV